VIVGEELEAHSATPTRGALLALAAVLREAGDAQPHERLTVGDELTRGGGDHYDLVLDREGREDVRDARVDGTRGCVDAHEEIDPFAERPVEHLVGDGIEIVRRRADPDAEVGAGVRRARGRDRSGVSRRDGEALDADLVGVGVAGSLARESANADPLDEVRRALDLATRATPSALASSK
jgi:hypothetical protein